MNIKKFKAKNTIILGEIRDEYEKHSNSKQF